MSPQPQEDESADVVLETAESSEFDDEAALLTTGDKTLSAIGYISFLCILPLVIRPQSPFCQFHGKQALLVLVLFMILSPLQWFSWHLNFLYAVLLLGVVGWGAYSAYKGRYLRMPILADLADKYLRWGAAGEIETEDEKTERLEMAAQTDSPSSKVQK